MTDHCPTLLEQIDEAAPRIACMGRDAIAECHALGVPAWVEDRETGRIVRLEPDGSRHFEEPRPYTDHGLEVLRGLEPAHRRPKGHVVDGDSAGVVVTPRPSTPSR